jgi:hypothetical protein
VVSTFEHSHDYFSSFIDPLADDAACQRDLPLLQQLGVNTVRVYRYDSPLEPSRRLYLACSVNASLDHDNCVKALADADIYLL